MAIVLLSAGTAAATDFVVDRNHPRADDSNPGTASEPWKTLGKAAASLEPGDTVLVKAGIYRERLVPQNSGTAEKPITYRAAPGERVIISGADRLTGWQQCTSRALPEHPHAAKLYRVELDRSPEALFADGEKLPMAREPDEGWWVAEGGGENTLVDRRHLAGDLRRFEGAEVFWWDVNITAQAARTVKGADNGTLTLEKPWGSGRTVEGGRDRYRIRGNPAMLDRPGEWAVRPHGDGYRLYLWPPGGKRPDRMLIEAARRGRFLVEYGGHGHLAFRGFEVRHGTAHGIGSWARGPEDIRIIGCRMHHNLGNGVYVRFADGATVRDCRITHNRSGLSCGTSEHVVIEGNEIAHNKYDGLIVSHDSHDVLIRRNFIHDHNRWGHPDNVQFYRGVSEVRLEENVLLNGGQALMMEDVESGRLTDNLIVGTGVYAVILGHDTVENFTVDHNTIALSGWGCVSSTRGRHTVTNNILCPGPGTALASGTAEGLTADHNLFWKPGAFGGNLFAVARQWTRSLEEHRGHTGLNAHSLRADPRFRSAPAFWSVMDGGRLTDCTRSRLYLRSDAGVFREGDRVEVRFDGRRRTVTRVGEDFIEVDPPLDALPEKSGTILNWRDGDVFRLDFRLSQDSPARGAASDGSDPGTTLSLPDLRDGAETLRRLTGRSAR